MSAAEFGSTASPEMSRFQGLSAGKTDRLGRGGGTESLAGGKESLAGGRESGSGGRESGSLRKLSAIVGPVSGSETLSWVSLHAWNRIHTQTSPKMLFLS